MMREELLPCPFCGAEAYCCYDNTGRSASIYIGCKNCDYSLSDSYRVIAEKDAAIAAWNTRAPSSALAEKDAMIEVAAQAIYEDARKACREMAKGAQHADFVSDDYIKGFETGLHAADVAILIRANAYHLKTLADLDGAR